jgi:tRNA A-37 threonylcarbamoyl transferase component Bud32
MSAPARLGKYEIVATLGQGAMGVVYKAFDPGIQRTVAIKTVRKELLAEGADGPMMLARFRNEARAAGRLSHPGIVAVYDYGDDGELAYLAMEFVQGASLREYFDAGTRFSEPEAVSIMAQLLEALQHAHEQGVWHRDVKPANLIITDGGRLKIADFGIAKIDSSHLTQTGLVMGSPGYMAPEQFTGGAIDWRADLFAAGVVMYELLTGARAFTGTTAQVAYRICHETPPAPSAVEPGRGWERYDAVVMRALAKDPDARFPTAGAFCAAILAAHGAPAAATLSGGSPGIEPRRRTVERGAAAPTRIDPHAPTVIGARADRAQRRGRYLGLAVVLLAVLGVGGWLLRGTPPAAAPTTVSPPAAQAPAPARVGPDPVAPPAPVATAALPRAAATERPAPAAPAAPRPATQPEPPADPRSSGFWRDQAITTKVAGKLHFNRNLWRSGIEVETKGGVVTLRGSVPSSALIAEAVSIAGGVSGVRAVRSELRVGPPAQGVAGGAAPP